MAKWQSELSHCDAVLLFGPHPLSALFDASKARSSTHIPLGERKSRCLTFLSVPSRKARSQLSCQGARGSAPLPRADWGAIVVGDEMAKRYSAILFDAVLETGISLVRSADFQATKELDRQLWRAADKLE